MTKQYVETPEDFDRVVEELRGDLRAGRITSSDAHRLLAGVQKSPLWVEGCVKIAFA